MKFTYLRTTSFVSAMLSSAVLCYGLLYWLVAGSHVFFAQPIWKAVAWTGLFVLFSCGLSLTALRPNFLRKLFGESAARSVLIMLVVLVVGTAILSSGLVLLSCFEQRYDFFAAIGMTVMSVYALNWLVCLCVCTLLNGQQKWGVRDAR
jgi:hypothetical protein